MTSDIWRGSTSKQAGNGLGGERGEELDTHTHPYTHENENGHAIAPTHRNLRQNMQTD